MIEIKKKKKERNSMVLCSPQMKSKRKAQRLKLKQKGRSTVPINRTRGTAEKKYSGEERKGI